MEASWLFGAICYGLLPMSFWAILIWWFDRYEKEPLPLLGFAFLWGMAPAVVLSLTLEWLFGIPLSAIGYHPVGNTWTGSGLAGPLIEETIKGVGLMGIFWVAWMEIDGVLDGIIYASLVGFGFATSENILFFLSDPEAVFSTTIVIQRVIVFGLNHATFTAFSGFGIALAKYSERWTISVLWIVLGLTCSVLFHSLFNFGMLLAVSYPAGFLISYLSSISGLLIIALLFYLSLHREGQAIKQFLKDDVDMGFIAAQDWQMSISFRKRLSAEWQDLSRLDFASYRKKTRLFALLGELALKERQRAHFGPSRPIMSRIHDLQIQIGQIYKAS